jgi:GH24 family phage-related lysozyme (muramidase)
MANADLVMSANGLARLKADEGVIDGLYDDPSGYCTFGVGHLVHRKEKWCCFLLQAASGEEAFKKHVARQWPGQPYQTTYLTCGAALHEKFGDLKTKAIAAAREAISRASYRRGFDLLSASEKAAVMARATRAVAEQGALLARTPDDVLKEDVTPFEEAVRHAITVSLTQAEFDALVSLCFNIGTGNFSRSSVVIEINRDAHKSGDAKDRRTAIDAIEAAFRKFNKSGGVVLNGLTKRRAAEASRFLAASRAELFELEKAAASGVRPKP